MESVPIGLEQAPDDDPLRAVVTDMPLPVRSVHQEGRTPVDILPVPIDG